MAQQRRLALLSVYDKAGIVEFARSLIDLGWDLLSSGGTAEVIRNAGLPVTDVAEWVGGGAILGHKVVTLSREVHAGLLADFDLEAEVEEIERLGLRRIDLVYVNLYPLKEEIARAGSTKADVIAKTDIGGPTMLGSAAKGSRIVLCRPSQIEPTLEWLRNNQPNSEVQLNYFRFTADGVVADYRLASARYHSGGLVEGIIGTSVQTLKYGENGYQVPSRHHATDTDDPLALHNFRQVGGPEVSFVTMTDLDRLLQTLTHILAGYEVNYPNLFQPAIFIAVKHGNVCGAGWSNDPLDAAERCASSDPEALFGGVVMTNCVITKEIVEALLYTEDGKRILAGAAAPGFKPDAKELLEKKGGKRFVMFENPHLAHLTVHSLDTTTRIRPVRGGFLSQPNYGFVPKLVDLEPVCGEATKLAIGDLLLAWAIGSTSNSNTITVVRDGTLLANAVGQQSRVGSAKLAIAKAGDVIWDNLQQARAYSDSFFPFPDGIEVLADAGVEHFFATSGSKNDDIVIEFCRKRGLTLFMLPDSEARGFYGH